MKLSERLRALPGYTIPAMLLMCVWQFIVFELTKPIMDHRPHFDFTLPVDRAIPFLTWTSVIYLGSFVFWAAIYFYCGSRNRERAYRFFCADLMAKGICLVFFLLLPTTNVRPAVTGRMPWDFLMRMVYFLDTPTNLFPSIHCMMSWLCWLGVRNEPEAPRPLRLGALLSAVLIFISTLTTRQHVLVDVFGGILCAQVSYRVCAAPSLLNAYGKLIDKLSWRIMRIGKRRSGADQKE